MQSSGSLCHRNGSACTLHAQALVNHTLSARTYLHGVCLHGVVHSAVLGQHSKMIMGSMFLHNTACKQQLATSDSKNGYRSLCPEASHSKNIRVAQISCCVDDQQPSSTHIRQAHSMPMTPTPIITLPTRVWVPCVHTALARQRQFCHQVLTVNMCQAGNA